MWVPLLNGTDDTHGHLGRLETRQRRTISSERNGNGLVEAQEKIFVAGGAVGGSTPKQVFVDTMERSNGILVLSDLLTRLPFPQDLH